MRTMMTCKRPTLLHAIESNISQLYISFISLFHERVSTLRFIYLPMPGIAAAASLVFYIFAALSRRWAQD